MKRYFGFDPYEGDGKYGFVSYKSEEYINIGKYAKALNQKGINLWYDYGIPAGKDWDKIISEHIVGASFIVLFVTEKVFKSSVIMREIQTAEEWDIPVVPVFIENIDKSHIASDQATFFTQLKHKQGVDNASQMSEEEVADSLYELVGDIMKSDSEYAIEQRKERLNDENSSQSGVLADVDSLIEALCEVRADEKRESKIEHIEMVQVNEKKQQQVEANCTIEKSENEPISSVISNSASKEINNSDEIASESYLSSVSILNHSNNNTKVEKKNFEIKRASIKIIIPIATLALFVLLYLILAVPIYTYDIVDDEVRITGVINKVIITDVTIPEKILGKPVVSIGESTFAGCHWIKSVDIPYSVEYIGKSAFSNCKSLERIDLPPNITSIEVNSFAYCKSLTSVTIPDSVTSINRNAFANCESLTNIYIPESVTFIEKTTTLTDSNGDMVVYADGAFDCCFNLTIYSESGSYAETYAKENNIPFVAE